MKVICSCPELNYPMSEKTPSTQPENQEDSGSDLDSQINESKTDSLEAPNGSRILKKRSSKGCITCKIRKKRCDEVKPICGDCKRLNRKCAYITSEMSSDEKRVLKEEMKLIEKNSKARHRKKKVRTDDDDFRLKKKARHTAKIVFNPLAMHMAPVATTSSFQGFSTNSSTGDMNSKQIPWSKIGMKQQSLPESANTNQANTDTPRAEYITGNGTSKLEDEKANKIMKPLTEGEIISNNTNSQDFAMREISSQTSFVPVLSPSFDISNFISSLPQDGASQNGDGISNTNTPFVPPLSLNGEENPTSFIDLFSNGFSKLLHDHFKTENLPASKSQNDPNNMPQIQDAFRFSPRFQPTPLSDQVGEVTTVDGNTDPNPNFRIPDRSSYGGGFDTALNFGFPYDSTNNPGGNLYTDNSGSKSGKENNTQQQRQNQNKILDMIKSNIQPQIYTNPSIVLNSTLAGLTPIGKRLYEYYRDKLSFIVCSAPKVENMYLNTFLPMAHIDKSVLYGILAWSAFHLGGAKMEKQGNYYIKLALDRFSERPILDEEVKGNLKLVCDDVNDDDDELVKEVEGGDDVEIYEDLELSRLNRDNMINMRLAAFLILCGVEICKGDVSKWSKYLTYGAKLIKLKGGLERFNESKDEHFLVTNYAYHDITAIQVINERTIHFDLNEYEKMWIKSNELGFADPLHGISSPVFKILAEINKLVIVVQKLIKRSMKDETKTPESRDGGKDNDTKSTQEKMAHGLQNRSKNVAESPEEKIHGLNEEHYWIGNDFEGSSVTSSDGIFMNGIPSTVSDEWVDVNFDKEVALEDLDQVMIECQNIEQRIAGVKPKIALCVSNRDLELQLTMFECFQVTAKIHLRQSVLRMNSASIEIQYLTTQLVKLLDVLLESDVEACLCFPMFIAGMNCVWKKDREGMTRRFKAFINRYKWKNVLRCQIVIRYIWELNHRGEKFVDWYAVVKTLGWDLSFA